MQEDDVKDGEHELQSKPLYYIRSSSPIQVGTIIAILGSTLALLTFFWDFSDRIQENSKTELRNERNERINQDQWFRQELKECCGRRR